MSRDDRGASGRPFPWMRTGRCELCDAAGPLVAITLSGGAKTRGGGRTTRRAARVIFVCAAHTAATTPGGPIATPNKTPARGVEQPALFDVRPYRTGKRPL